MATVVDASGNTPFANSDVSMGAQKLAGVDFQGAQQSLTLGAASVQSNKFSRQARWLRITCPGTGGFHYETGINPTADGSSPYLPQEAVEIIPIVGNERIAVIQDASETNVVIITEDK